MKKAIAWLLVLCMSIGLLPVGVVAAGNALEPPKAYLWEFNDNTADTLKATTENPVDRDVPETVQLQEMNLEERNHQQGCFEGCTCAYGRGW